MALMTFLSTTPEPALITGEILAAADLPVVNQSGSDRRTTLAMLSAFVVARFTLNYMPTPCCLSSVNPVESSNSTTLTSTSGTIYDANLNAFTLVKSRLGGLGTALNGAYQNSTADVIWAGYYDRTFYTKNSSSIFHRWNGTSFDENVPDPRSTTRTGTATGAFYVSGGRIYDPQGSVYRARGVNVANWAATGNGAVNNVGNGTANGNFLLQLLPGCNMVRLNCQLEPVGTFDNFVSNVTKAKCVVVFEYHRTDSKIPNPQTDTLLWYGKNAKHYKLNPYVWFGTINEPGNPTNSTVANMHKAIYDAVRASGSKTPVMISIDSPYQNIKPYANHYSDMINVIWDIHYYGYALKRDIGFYSKDQVTINNNLASNIYLVQMGTGIFSRDGTMPLIVGEYGTSTDGNQPDVNGVQVVNAVHFADCSGAVAWAWSAGASDRIQDQGVLKSFGRTVRSWMAGSPPRTWSNLDDS